jgi:hypothetical protein
MKFEISHMAAIFAATSIVCIGSGWVVQLTDRDSFVLVAVGRNLTTLGYTLAATAVTYTSEYVRQAWNNRRETTETTADAATQTEQTDDEAALLVSS